MPLTIERNPMGFYCPPNGAAADVISETDFERFVAYGLLRCYADLGENSFSEHEKVDDEHIRELREAFLAVVEGTLLFLWEGEFEIGQTNFDADMLGDGTSTTVGNSDEGDEVECMFQWTPFRIDEDQIIFEMYCNVLAGEGNGGDPTTLFLDMEAVQDRAKVREIIRKARDLNKCPYRTEYQEKWENEHWERVLADA